MAQSSNRPTWPATINVTQDNPTTGRQYRADSDWEPSAETLLYQLTQGGFISYRRGYPDFSTYTEFTAPVIPMQGINSRDFASADTQFGASRQFAPFSQQSVAQWKRNSTNFTTPRTLVIPNVGGPRKTRDTKTRDTNPISSFFCPRYTFNRAKARK